MLYVGRSTTAFKGCLDNDIRSKCKSENIRLVHSYYKDDRPDAEKYNIYENIPKATLLPLDNKASFASIMCGNPYVPQTYYSIDDLPDENKTWFIKCRYGANGRNVKCMTTEQLKSYELGSTEIIQTAITDLDLMNGCKYTIRAYMLFHNNQMYIYDDACCIKHADPYDPHNTDHSVQVNHKGYYEDGSNIKLSPLKRNSNYEIIFENMKKMLKSVKPNMEPYYKQSTKTTYVIWGIDILVESDFDVKLIEMNVCPNLTQIESIRQSVTYKMLNNMFRTVLGLPQDGFVMID